eukprot:SAG31_NODE_7748_length_1605_cov_1.125498_1_plen_286_part_10
MIHAQRMFCHLVQAYTARRAEHNLAAQAHEMHALELERQREHEQRQAKIRRTERWVDDCCAPAYQALAVYLRSRVRFVGGLACMLYETDREAFEELYHSNGYSMNAMKVAENGVVSGDHVVRFDPTRSKGTTWLVPTCSQSLYFAHRSPATIDVAVQDLAACYKGVYVRELPQSFFELMSCNLDGQLAEYYRGYIRRELKPAMDRVTAILHDHYAAIEMPSKDWLMETFAGHVKTDSTDQIVDYSFIGYTRAWNRVLMQWDAGHLDELFPHNHMMPFHGMYRILMW